MSAPKPAASALHSCRSWPKNIHPDDQRNERRKLQQERFSYPFQMNYQENERHERYEQTGQAPKHTFTEGLEQKSDSADQRADPADHHENHAEDLHDVPPLRRH